MSLWNMFHGFPWRVVDSSYSFAISLDWDDDYLYFGWVTTMVNSYASYMSFVVAVVVAVVESLILVTVVSS
jgi:hypothetical protein